MLHMFKKIFFFLLSYFLFVTPLFCVQNFDPIEPYCEGQINFVKKNDLKVKFLEIKTKNSRKWSKNLLRLNTNNNKLILKKYKKNYKAIVYVEFSENILCKFDAKIKINGDFKDHISWVKGNPMPSLSVEFLNGNVLNITEFKLFLPRTREEDNEVFVANFLRHLGYLSPRTFYINASLNGLNQKYIFQENITKEFLENSNRKQGFIFEGDEKFVFG